MIAFVVVALGIVLTVRHGVRLFFYPAPGRMPASIGDVGEAIGRFEEALRVHAPEVLEGLRPGLSDEEIAEIESRWRVRLSEDLKVLYRWRDGSAGEPSEGLIPGHRFVPLEEAAERRAMMRAEVASQGVVQRLVFAVVAGHRTGWLCVLDDRAGDGYFFDSGRRRRAGSFFYHFAEDRQYRFFPSLADFLGGAAECYETGVYRVGRRGGLEEDHERAFEVWAANCGWFPVSAGA